MIKTSSRWFEGARSKKEQEEIVAILLSAQPAFERLAKILEKDKVSSYNYRLKKSTYENPSWPYIQADGVGEERALNSVLKLIDIKVENK